MTLKTIDEVLQSTGGFGRFQWRLMALMCYCMMLAALQSLSMTFLVNDPAWKCSENSHACNSSNIVTPNMKMYKDNCKLNDSDWFYVNSKRSAVVKFELTCDRSILKYIATSMIFLGWFSGSIVFGFISDKFGRRIGLILPIIVMATSGTISTFVSGLWLFIALKFLVGSGVGGTMLCVFILNTEFAGPKKRAIAGVVLWYFWTAGLSLLALFAFLLQDWKHLNLAVSVPGFTVLFFLRYLPESARWYLVNNKADKAIDVLKEVSRINKIQFPEDVMLHNKQYKESLLDNVVTLLSSKSHMKYLIICISLWFSSSAIYYGVAMSASALGGNIYLVFFLTNMAELPSTSVAMYVFDRYGRKKSTMFSLFFGSVALVAASSFPVHQGSSEYTWLKVSFAMIAKFLVTMGFDALYVYTYEIYSTDLRNGVMGITSSCARLGSFTASYILYLRSVNYWLPFAILGGMGVGSSLLCLLLPETNNTPTKETLKESVSLDSTMSERQSIL